MNRLRNLAGLHLVLFVGLLLGHDIDLPLRKLTGEADILSAAANGLGKLFLVDCDIHRSRLLVDDNGDHVGRGHRVDDVLRRILVPQDDVHAFTGQFVRHRLNPGAAHSDACTNGVDSGDVAANPDLRP